MWVLDILKFTVAVLVDEDLEILLYFYYGVENVDVLVLVLHSEIVNLL